MKKSGYTLACFSPPVMLATFVFELTAAIYLFVRQKYSTRKILTMLILVALGTFQLAEYMLCLGFGFDAEVWSKIGYVAITTLPPMGLHLLHTIEGAKHRRLVQFCYTLMAGYIVTFLAVPTVFLAHRCTGNYVIFELNPTAITFYSGYYYLILLASVIMGSYWAWRTKSHDKKPDLKKYNQLVYHVIGYLLFMLPVIVVQSVDPQTVHGIPSIMCGFAVLLAVTMLYAFKKDKTLAKQA